MKTCFAALVALFISFAISAQNLPSRWNYGKVPAEPLKSAWENGHSISATKSGTGVMKAVDAEGKDLESYRMINGRPAAGPFKAGDCFLYEIPAGNLPAGSFLSFDATLAVEPGGPMDWVVEWQDDGMWVCGKKIRCYGPAFGSDHKYSSIYQTFRLSASPNDGVLRVRLRALDGSLVPVSEGREPKAYAHAMFVPSYVGTHILDLGTEAPEDTTRVLCIGNSATYYHSCPCMLKEIAWNEGHYLDIEASLKGGRTMEHHLTLEMTEEHVMKGGFDVVFLQDQTQSAARVASDRKKYGSNLVNIAAMADKVRSGSPDCRVVVESIWAYPGRENGGFSTVDEFYRLQGKGTKMLAKAAGRAEVSPIRDAFRLAWLECPDIMLFAPDGAHTSPYGSYLKSCVNYLVIFGEPFSGPVADCGLDKKKAERLRRIAQQAVLK